MKNTNGEIFVIDNNSTDESYSFFQNQFKEVNFIWNKTNEGFAKANNQALKIASGEYILFLNPDTLISEDCFEKCISFIKSNNNNCALGIKMLDGAGNFLRESKRAFPSPMTSLYKLLGLAKFFPHSKIFAKYHLGYLNENENHEVDVLAGAFMMVPNKILAVVGGFDEDFFMYGEDIDFSFRIQKAGFKNFYFSESTIIHFKGESTKKGSLNYVKMFYKAMSVFVKKHYGSTRAGLFNFLIQAAILFRACLAAIARFVKWKAIEKADKKNKINQAVIVATPEEFSVVSDFIEKGDKKENVLGRVATEDMVEPNAIDTFNNLGKVLESYPVKEIVFCEGNLSFKKIIETLPLIPHYVTINFFAKGSHAIIGSEGAFDKKASSTSFKPGKTWRG